MRQTMHISLLLSYSITNRTVVNGTDDGSLGSCLFDNDDGSTCYLSVPMLGNAYGIHASSTSIECPDRTPRCPCLSGYDGLHDGY